MQLLSSALPAEIPPPRTGSGIETLVRDLSHEIALPPAAVRAATLRAHEIAPEIVAAIERAAAEDIDPATERLFFRGVHILGAGRVGAAYRPLVTFLRGPQQRVDRLLGDTVTETLSRILAGLFDGDAGPLFALVVDTAVASFVREAALQALAFLTFERRIERAVFEAFLVRLDDTDILPPEDDVLWHAWMTAVAVLGMQPLVPRVRAAFADRRIAPYWCDEGDFDLLLQPAIERPDDPRRLEGEQMGYLEDALAALERFEIEEDDFAGTDALDRVDLKDGFSTWLASHTPAHNPYRAVGRNDPCPCGSGKKFKKCCGKPQ